MIDMFIRKYDENLDLNVNKLLYMLFNKVVVKLEVEDKCGYVWIVCIKIYVYYMNKIICWWYNKFDLLNFDYY